MTDLAILLVIGYLAGSLSPGYFWGRVIKGLDIRNFGNGNTGASNTYRVVGPVYGIITAVFDLLKSPLAYYFSLSRVDPDLAILVGLAAVLGHIFPFYLRFRGGKGVASLDGLFLISLFFASHIYSFLLFVGMIIYYATVVKPIRLSLRHWLKLGALIFPLSLIWMPFKLAGGVLVILFAVAVAFDLIRKFNPELNKKYLEKQRFAKEKERSRFSGYTIFLFSALLVSLFFSREIAAVSLVFFILGDIFAPLSREVAYLPQIKVIGDKTLAGAIVVFTTSFFAGLFLHLLTPLSLSLEVVAAGALFTAIFDQLAFFVDDNLLVPIGVATTLSLIGVFL
ncbi:MAG: glycerol-3-phosphate acyltransferase [Candidatus Yanofskybacteria bacterium]|nr:glycerol-3-phosphate acyltransferase [Candidatus Yanofskybacteria bacterium]